MKNRFLFLSTIFSLIFFLEPLSAQEKVYQLSIKEATQLALSNNFDIQLAKYEVWLVQNNLLDVKSIFDTILAADINYIDDQFKKSSIILGTKSLENKYDVSLSKKFPSATTLTAQMSNDRLWTNSAFTTSSLNHDSSLGIAIKQELGRNFFGLKDRSTIKLTKIDIENTQYTSLDKIEAYIAQVQKAYWELVFHIQKMQLLKDVLLQSKKLYESDQENLKSGIAELAEALISESNYKRQKNELLIANQEVQAKSNVLALLLNLDHHNLMIQPVDALDYSLDYQDWNSYLAEAFKYRRDYKKLQNDVQSRNIQLTMTKNELWPEINLTASFKRNGLGDHFKQAIDQISEEDNPYFSAGLSIEIPLENSEARSGFKKAQLEKAKTLIKMKLLEKIIAIELMDQIRECRVFMEMKKNNEEIAKLQLQKYEEEEKKFNAGRSDMDTLTRFQNDAIQARILDLEIKYKFQTSLIHLKQKSALLLNQYWKEEF